MLPVPSNAKDDYGFLTMDEESVKRRRAERLRRLHTQTIPRLRLVGFLWSIVLMLLAGYMEGERLWSDENTGFVVWTLGYCLATELVCRLWYRPERGSEWLPRTILAADVVVGSYFVFVTGGPESPFFYFPYVRVFDQVFYGARWALWMLCAAAVGQVSVFVLHSLEHAGVLLTPRAVVVASGTFFVGLYVALTARVGARMATRSRSTIRLARKLLRDLTQSTEDLEEARKDAEAASEAKGRFLATMTHELRTPMNGIIGMAELALSTDLDREQREYVDAVRASARSLLNVVNDVLDLSKLDAGAIEAEDVEFSLLDTLQDVARVTAPPAFAKNVEVVVRIAPAVPDACLGDPAKLRHVLVNLVGNAVKFTEAGHVALSIEREADSARTRFIVEDTGVGIAPDKLASVFDPFTQAEQSTSRRFGGTGLGLPIAKRLTEAMGGEISITSDLGKGTRMAFEVVLGAAREDSAGWAERAERGGPDVVILHSAALSRAQLATDVEALGRTAVPCASVAELEAALAAAEPGVAVVAQIPREEGDQGVLDSLALSYSGAHWVLLQCQRPAEPWKAPALLNARFALPPLMGPELAELLTSVAVDDDAPRFERSSADQPGHAGLRILLVEDNPINQRVAQRLLELWGHGVTLAENGLLGVERAVLGGFDIILMDVQMPELDGLEATRRIRAFGSDHPMKDVPIVALTANTDAQDQRACFEAGMNDLLLKPIDVDAFRELLEARCRELRPGASPTEAA